MDIPLEKRLRKRLHVDVARLQDEVIDVLYSLDNNLVLHGGTAIWRCYGGNRFSEDLDLYGAVGLVKAGLEGKLKERGLSLLKFKTTDNLAFGKVSDGRTEVRVEINHAAKVSPVVRQYEKVDGSFVSVFCLSEEHLMREKIKTYADRKFVRDLYDLHHLSARVKGNPEIEKQMKKLLAHLPTPIDAENLPVLIYSGAIPTVQQLTNELKRRYE